MMMPRLIERGEFAHAPNIVPLFPVVIPALKGNVSWNRRAREWANGR